MKLVRVISLFALAALLAASSCQKEEEETTTVPSLEGTLKLSQKFPAYVENGQEFIIVPSGVSLPAGDSTKTVGYFYYLSTNSSKKDTSRIWDVKIPALDTLGSLTLYGYAYASGYSLKSVTTSTEIVNDNMNGTGSIQGFDLRLTDPFISGASGKPYYYDEIGGRTWLRLNWAEGPAGTPRKNCESVSYIFGRYYNWYEAMTVCPEGWELPSKADWDALHALYPCAEHLMASVTFNGKEMWEYSPRLNIDDSSRMSIFPSGYANIGDEEYDYLGVNRYAVFWTSDEDPLDDDYAVTEYFYYDRNEMFTDSRDKDSFAASVRCVKKK